MARRTTTPPLDAILRALQRGKRPHRRDTTTTTAADRHAQLVAWVRLKIDARGRGPAQEETDATTGRTTLRDGAGVVVAIVSIFPGGLTHFGAPWPETRTRVDGERFEGSWG